MLDLFTIVTRGGIVLWQKQLAPVSSSIVNGLIADVFITGASAASSQGVSAASGDGAGSEQQRSYARSGYTVKWTTSNDLGLIFVVVYQSLLRLNFVEELLANMQRILHKLYGEQIKQAQTTGADLTGIVCEFEYYFDKRLAELENSAGAVDQNVKAPTTQSADELKVPATKANGNTVRSTPNGTPVQERDDPVDRQTSLNGTPKSPGASSKIDGPGAKVAGGRRVVANKRNVSGRQTPTSVASSDDEGTAKSARATKGKIQRRWNADGTVDDSAGHALDFSSGNADEPSTNGEHMANDNLDEFIGEDATEATASGQRLIRDLDSLLLDDDDAASTKDKAGNGSGLGRGAFSFFSSFVAGKTLTEADLAPACEKMRQHLLGKNVANEVCSRITDGVRASLVGQKCGTFDRTSRMVQDAVEASLRRVLTPVQSVDLLDEIARVRGRRGDPKSGRPFTISFVGVNGVGKSTNLGKVAYWLLSNDLRVLICACDTFRSGAVEQLRVHVTRLKAFIANQRRATSGPDAHEADVELFERGYGKDPASIANDAIAHAYKNGFDVVLIDTAGRRHNDARLMQGLERFVATVNTAPHCTVPTLPPPPASGPNAVGVKRGIDRIWQVAEALVGTDSVAQARHFNAALGPQRDLDGFIISKVDTVGDLVGTIVSMVHATGAPVVFVGVGQMYTDLRGMSVPWVVQQLMSA